MRAGVRSCYTRKMTVIPRLAGPLCSLAFLASACGGADSELFESGSVLQDVERRPSPRPEVEPEPALGEAEAQPPGADLDDPGSDPSALAPPLDGPGAPDGFGGCTAPSGFSGAPGTVEELIGWINGLPKPVTIACFIESLERPLDLFMTSSTFSLQPAAANNPRTFIVLDSLVLSVVPGGGASSRVLEFGMRTADRRSAKGEIAFPVRVNITDERLEDQVGIARNASVCGGCHTGETRTPAGPYEAVFESNIIQPNLMYEVSIESMQRIAEDCNPGADAVRCANLRALFQSGPVRRSERWQ